MDVLRAALRSDAAKRALYVSGALDAWHRGRNRHRLTVVMFHRVLAPRDPRFAVSDPEYTLSDELFARSLEFFQRHYHPIALEDLAAARAGERTLPDRPLLLTFDDGWSDNVEYALPHLRRAGLPSVLFVAGSAIGRREPFWQEQLVHAWRAGRLDAARARALWREAGPGDAPGLGGRDALDGLRAVIARLEQVDRARRAALLAGLGDALTDDARHMIVPEQLGTLAAGRVAIGAHGYSHEPLTRVDAAAELARVREALAAHVPVAPALSFPHGRFDADAVAHARAAGFPLLFTSVPELPRADGRGPALLGRVGFTADMITDGARFAPERLALHLFRRPHAAA
jgi:peptidoglycan/xylan/chitin deacetylase (PgdA/CDA1 family)